MAYIIEPRFPGGTSSAVAHEIRAVSRIIRPKIYGISSEMFHGTTVAPQLKLVLQELGLEVVWNPNSITADVVILQNPAFLKFQDKIRTRILANRLFVVTHENFLRPGGNEAFDVANCLNAINQASLCLEKHIAPISIYNRSTVKNWLGATNQQTDWSILPSDWFNICDFEHLPPTRTPKDRRGRLSRSGFEKFPSLRNLEICFPNTAERNVILGADTFLSEAPTHPHWELIPFRGKDVTEFFKGIDFMVYFTSPTWRESFGRVLAEAISAGKVVISDKETASTFGDAVVAAEPTEVENIIQNFIAKPETYQQQVNTGQRVLRQFSQEAFEKFFRTHVLTETTRAI